MKRSAVPLLIILALLVPFAAQAQATVVLDRLQVSLWPEYDRPGVLVIYRAVLPADQTLPVGLAFRIPAAAGEPSAVAYRQDDLNLISMPYERQVVGDLALVTFTTSVREVQFEYYDPALLVQDSNHRFVFTWPGDYAVGEFAVEVQQPVQATGIIVNPALGSGTLGSDGMTYFSATLGGLAAGQTQVVEVAYDKTGSGLSFERLQPVEPIARPASLGERLLAWPYWPWVLAAVGVMLVALAVVFFVRGRKGVGNARPGRLRHRLATEGGARLFCHNCGARAEAQAVFCSMCGTKLRRNE
ncbi:MAG TPA: zinc ribbon domain-containing protein [Anaerolineales bacterium]|nr:zinc ribbon domain-containing protein [Anaerolineales bacterium]